ncbi:S24/S26 family peptidase [Xanthobacter sp. VNH20]|uniref:S24/S26 family peptidase n=1 Tax=Xanthobacter sp. VNH20 TaxID=3156616 RepID=UPI0032B316D4
MNAVSSTVLPSGLVGYAVPGDAMHPTLSSQDIVLAAPVDGPAGEGLYVFDTGDTSPGSIAIYRVLGVQQDGEQRAALSKDNERYWKGAGPDPDIVSIDWFKAHVLGKVAVHCRVVDSGVLRGLS